MNDDSGSLISILTDPQQISAAFEATPWLWFALLLLPLLFLAAFRRVYPNVALALLLIVPIVGSLAVLANPGALAFVFVCDGIIALVAFIDLFTLPPVQAVSVERQTMKIASIAQNHRVTLTVSNHSKRAVTVWVRDDVPQEFTPSRDEFVVRLKPRSRSIVSYDMKASRRGAFRMRKHYLRVRSRFMFWQTFRTRDDETVINVYPDMKQLAEYAILARTNRLTLMGVRRTRRIGQDNEFERLRDFTRDDNYKHIDWRSTARRRKLTVKDFQSNQSQRILFLLDCGRMMTNRASGLTLLDHSLNSMLMMSYVALQQGDSVGLICFSDRVHTFVPPRSGMKQMNQLLHASYDRFPQLVESRYDEAFLHLRTHCQKRSLVVLISNVIDEVNSNQLHLYLSSMVGRHLPLGVLLRDHHLFDAADTPPHAELDLYRAAAASEILTWRHQVLTDLEHQGVLVIDTFPEEMTAPLVNRYLEIKARHLL